MPIADRFGETMHAVYQMTIVKEYRILEVSLFNALPMPLGFLCLENRARCDAYTLATGTFPPEGDVKSMVEIGCETPFYREVARFMDNGFNEILMITTVVNGFVLHSYMCIGHIQLFIL